MIGDKEPEESDRKRYEAHQNGYSELDTTHQRFRKRLVYCGEGHEFKYSELTKHFRTLSHVPTGASCPHCGRGDIFEYYEVSNLKFKREFHKCRPRDQPIDQSTDPGQASSDSLTRQDNSASSSNSTPVKLESDSQQHIESKSDGESSGIGNSVNSLTSVVSYDNRRMSDVSKAPSGSAESVSSKECSPDDSSK